MNKHLPFQRYLLTPKNATLIYALSLALALQAPALQGYASPATLRSEQTHKHYLMDNGIGRFLTGTSSMQTPMDREVRGTVTDADGHPVAGVVVRAVANPGNVALTDKTGHFSITVAGTDDKLSFSYVGYEKVTATALQDGLLNITLRPASGMLSEVVVNGYTSTKRPDLTGAVSLVGSDALSNKSYTSVDQNLQGRVAGLQSTGASGQPGALQQLRIRGTGSITAGADPLFVVDGVIINSGQLSRTIATSDALSAINPNDIESVNVLKDAAASAIYGSRAANGVIVITTKRGTADATKISVNAEYGLSDPRDLPAAGRPLNTAEWRTLTAQGILNNPSFAAQNNVTSANVMNYVDNTLGAGSGISTDWLKLVQRTGRQQQYNVSISGGNEITQYRVSGGYFKQQGSTIASDFDRYSFNADLRTQLSKKVQVSTSIVIGQSGQNTSDNTLTGTNPISQAVHLLPFVAPYAADGSINTDPASFQANGVFNPLYVALNDKSHLDQFKGIGSLSIDYNIIDGLKYTSRIGLDLNNLNEDYYNNPTHGNGIYYGGLSTRNYTRYFTWIWTNMLDYRFIPDDEKNWNIGVKAGYESQRTTRYDLSLSMTGLPASSSLNVPSNGSTPYSYGGTNDGYSIASVFTLADVSYKGKYVLSGSYRRDGSSKFSENRRYGNFWSVGGAWNIHEEDALRELNWLNVLKLRGSYGLTGNANISSYAWRQLYSYGVYAPTGENFNYNGATGSGPTSVGNPYLTWETSKQFDLGTDMAFFNNRLALTFDYYSRRSANLLLDQPTSSTTGTSSFINNVGTMRNRGIEFSVSGTPVIAGDFKWRAGFSISHNTNKIIALVDNKDIATGSVSIASVGKDLNTFYLRQWAGVDPANGSPLWYTDETGTATTSNYNLAALVAKYSATPKVFGSFTTGFSYKGFNLDGLIYYNFGNYVQDLWARYTQSDGAYPSLNQYASQLNAWNKPGDITNTPIYVFNNANNSNRVSSRFLYKGDYIRLRELNLSYDIPSGTLSKYNLTSLRIYTRATNLFTWVKDKNIPFDPEAGLSGLSSYYVPIPRIFTLGIIAQF